MDNEQEEFYVGYLPHAPTGIRKQSSKIVYFLILLTLLVAALISLHQYRIVNSTFEYRINTQVEGVFFKAPIPHLIVQLGTSSSNESLHKMIPLVGYGKTGVLGLIDDIENKLGKNLVGKRITLNGSLIYHDGKVILQILEEDNRAVVEINDAGTASNMVEDLGDKGINGEIIDPKCYFGVMNPGEGKPHKSYAIRCISGGIPPVFYNRDERDYYFLVNEKLQPLRDEVLQIIGDYIHLNGKALQLHDWKLLVVTDSEVKKAELIVMKKKLLRVNTQNIAICMQ